MNRLFLSTSLALALSTTIVFAQQQDAAPATAPTANHHRHAHNPQREAARLSKKLNLTSDQTTKLEPILANRDQKIAALRSDTSITPMIAKQQMRAIHNDTKQQLAIVLTPDQLQQMKALHHGHGNQNQAQPSTTPPAGL
jgi:protein CpxP